MTDGHKYIGGYSFVDGWDRIQMETQSCPDFLCRLLSELVGSSGEIMTTEPFGSCQNHENLA